jgi:hypothetical protein
MANKDHITNEKDFTIPEGWSEVTRPPIESGGGAQVPPVAADRFASGAISTMTLGLNTDIANSQMGGNVPNFRVQPPQPSAIADVNAAVQSFQKLVPPSTAASATTDDDTPIINENVQTGTSYLVTLADRDTLISMTNNAGGFVTLPGSASSFGYVQTAKGGGAGNSALATFSSDNRLGNFLIATASSSQTVGPTNTIGDSAGNTWVPIATISNSGKTSQWYAANCKAGPNAVIAFQPGPMGSFQSLVVDEFSGISLTGGLDQFATGVGSASIVPTVTNTFAFVAARYGLSTTGVQPTAGAGYTQIPWTAIQWSGPPSANEFVVGLDEYLVNPAVGATLVGSGTGAGIGSFEFIMANFRLQAVTNAVFPVGWYTYVENTGTGTFFVQSSANIDGKNQQIKLLPNTGVLIVSDGFGYWTERGVAPVVTFETNSVLNSSQTVLNLIAGNNMTITDLGAGGIRFASTGGGGGGTSQSILSLPKFFSAPANINPINAQSFSFTANSVKFLYMHIDAPITVGNFTFNVTTSDTNHYDWGMYTTAGVLVWNLGPQVFNSVAVVTKPFVQGTITIQAGNYWLAFTGDGTGLTFSGATPSQQVEYFYFANAPAQSGTGPTWWTSVTSSTGGSLTGLGPTVPAAPTTAANLTSNFTTGVTAAFWPIITLST